MRAPLHSVKRAILSALVERGDRMLADVAQAVGMEKPAVGRQLALLTREGYLTRSGPHNLSQWSITDAGRRKLTGILVRAPAGVAQILQLLDETPGGLWASEIHEQLGGSFNSLKKDISRLRKAGKIEGLTEPDDHASRRLRYYLQQHEAAAMAKHAQVTAQRARQVRPPRPCEIAASAKRAAQYAARLEAEQRERIKRSLPIVPGRIPDDQMIREAFFSAPGYRPEMFGRDTVTARRLAGAL